MIYKQFQEGRHRKLFAFICSLLCWFTGCILSQHPIQRGKKNVHVNGLCDVPVHPVAQGLLLDRKSTRLNSSHIH